MDGMNHIVRFFFSSSWKARHSWLHFHFLGVKEFSMKTWASSRCHDGRITKQESIVTLFAVISRIARPADAFLSGASAAVVTCGLTGGHGWKWKRGRAKKKQNKTKMWSDLTTRIEWGMNWEHGNWPDPPGPPFEEAEQPLPSWHWQLLGRTHRPAQGRVQMAVKKTSCSVSADHGHSICLVVFSSKNLRMIHRPVLGRSVHPGQQ